MASKRNFMKPISGEEIAYHERMYEEKLKKESAKRQNKLKIESEYDPSKYHSKFLENVLDSEAQRKIEEEKKAKEISELLNKKNNYSKLIMETHKPQISKRKQMEMELIKQNLKEPTAFERMKKRMVSSSQNRKNKFQKLNSSIINQSSSKRSERKQRGKDFDWRSMNRIVGVSFPFKILILGSKT